MEEEDQVHYGATTAPIYRREEPAPMRFVRRRTYVKRNDCHEVTQIGNLLWLLLGGGLVMTIIYASLALAFTLSFVLLPFGFQMFKLAQLALFPFGKSIKPKQVLSEDDHALHPAVYWLGNVIWLPIGLALSIVHMVFACIAACTIIGAPFGLQHLKLAQLVIFPFGYEVIDGVQVTEEVVTTSTMDSFAQIHLHEGSIPIAQEIDEPLIAKPTAEVVQ